MKTKFAEGESVRIKNGEAVRKVVAIVDAERTAKGKPLYLVTRSMGEGFILMGEHELESVGSFEWAHLGVLIEDYANCSRADEVKGGGDPQSVPEIEAQLRDARRALYDYARTLLTGQNAKRI